MSSPEKSIHNDNFFLESKWNCTTKTTRPATNPRTTKYNTGISIFIPKPLHINKTIVMTIAPIMGFSIKIKAPVFDLGLKALLVANLRSVYSM